MSSMPEKGFVSCFSFSSFSLSSVFIKKCLLSCGPDDFFRIRTYFTRFAGKTSYPDLFSCPIRRGKPGDGTPGKSGRKGPEKA
jgi:hypothetical protein